MPWPCSPCKQKGERALMHSGYRCAKMQGAAHLVFLFGANFAHPDWWCRAAGYADRLREDDQDHTISNGEARTHLWNQIKADVMGEIITPPLRAEPPSIGAAILARLGTEPFGSVEDALAVVLELAPTITPDPATAIYAELPERWESVRGTLFRALSA